MSAVLKEKPPIVTIQPMYLNRQHAAAFLSMSESMLESMVSKGLAPRPRQLSAGRVAWLVEDLIAWGKSRPVSEMLPPEGAGYGRRGRPKGEAENQA